jgi:hypothetical protein
MAEVPLYMLREDHRSFYTSECDQQQFRLSYSLV